jgi:hypothetical protein
MQGVHKMALRIQLRRDTAANWTSTNPTLSQGELGFETDTYKIKIGNGSSAWVDLTYFSAAGLSAAQGLTFVGDDSSGTRISDGETIKIAGAGSVTTSMSGDVLTITGSGGGSSTITVVGDDSTGVTLNSGETIKIAGGTGITTAVSGDVLTITGVPQATMTFVGDDSTGTTLNNGETLKVAGGTGITTAIAGDVLTITATGGGGSMASRASLAGTTSSLANGATGDLTIVGYKGYMLYKIATSAAAWVRVYVSTAARSSDASRAEGADPTPGSGVIAEVISTASQTILISPGAIGFSNETSPSTNISLAVTNKSGSTAAITITLTAVQLEV